MTPREKRAAATDARVRASQLLREASQLDREAQLEDAEARAQQDTDEWYAAEVARLEKNAPA